MLKFQNRLLQRLLFPIRFALILVLGLWSMSASAETYIPSRTLNLVYDDSGSMIRLGRNYYDTWCQARYALEVLTAMMGERDTLNVFYMSDYYDSKNAPPRLQLHGSKDAATVTANVERVHNTITRAGYTPWQSVEAAYDNLKKINTDERWLVVLTDGEFEDGAKPNAEIEKFYQKVVSDGKTKVMMLAMGPLASVINSDESKGIYFEQAATSAEVPAKLTHISNRIFQRNVLKQVRPGVIEFGIPMSQLIIFAQGKEVQVQNIASTDKTFNPDSNVHAVYSTKATTVEVPNLIIADNLNGYVATFDQVFPPGTYNLGVTDAESIEVYYKPHVAVATTVFDEHNNEVTKDTELIEGKFSAKFVMINASTGEPLDDTSLLGPIEYSAAIDNKDINGKTETKTIKSGDSFELVEGTANVNVTAKFLEYNTVSDRNEYKVVFKNKLYWTMESAPDFRIKEEGLNYNSYKSILNVQMKTPEGIVPLTKEQCDALTQPTILINADKTPSELQNFVYFSIKKTDEVCKYELLIQINDCGTEPLDMPSGDVFFSVSSSYEKGDSSAKGSLDASITIHDDISTFTRISTWVKDHATQIISCILLFIFLLGYVVKDKLPKRLKDRPKVEKTMGIKMIDDDMRAKVVKKRLTFILPYVAQQCVFQLQSTKLELKAIGGGRMAVTNTSAYVRDPECRDRTGVQFDGDYFEYDENRPRAIKKITAGTTISVIEEDGGKYYTYTCMLNT